MALSHGASSTRNARAPARDGGVDAVPLQGYSASLAETILLDLAKRSPARASE